MKKMKLELKHIAPYLPYKLKAVTTAPNVLRSNPTIRTIVLDHTTYDLNTVGLNHVLQTGVLILPHKPILRPLSDLTEEIEVSEDRFIPIIELFNKFFVVDNPKVIGHKDFWCVDSFRNDLRTRYSISKNQNSISISFYSSSDEFGGYGSIPYQYDMFQMLLNWHFDIFGLIEKGLAIDINTLND